ncbi:MAG: sulfatase [Planctomycetota bacterium]
MGTFPTFRGPALFFRPCSILLIFSLVTFLVGCGSKTKPSMVLIVVDTLRADYMGCYGYTKDTTPNLDRLAEEGVLFSRVFAASPWTGPSVSSITTGMYPDEVGVRDLRDGLTPRITTLAERLKKAGYHTGAVVSNTLAGPTYGHDQGYDSFLCEPYKAVPKEAPYGDERLWPAFTADQVTDKALEWLKTARKPFFLHVHYTDPHDPYIPPAAWRNKFLENRQPLDIDLLLEENFTHADLSPEELDRLRAGYEGEIAFADHEIGRLIDQLPDHTLVAFTGDHGEEFLEHGGFLHGNSLFQELLRIPLIFKGADLPEGVQILEPVSHVDITPTLVDAACIPLDPGFSGFSLLPFMRSRSQPPLSRPLFSVLESRTDRRIAVKEGDWRFEVHPEKRSVFLYNLKLDPRELKNVAMEHTDLVKSFIDSVKNRNSRLMAAPEMKDKEVQKEREAILRNLGYIK